MKKISVLTFGLILAATPAFAGNDGYQGNDYGHQDVATQGSVTAVDQTNVLNSTGNAWNGWAADSAGNGGVSGVDTTNSAGVITQNVNTGATSNVGSATNVAITGGLSIRGGNIDAGNPNDKADQVSGAFLNQVNAYNSTGNALCLETSDSTYNSGVSHVGITGSQGIITQQINAGVTSNVGSAIGVAIH